MIKISFKINNIIIIIILFILIIVTALSIIHNSNINIKTIKKPIINSEMMKGYSLERSNLSERKPDDEPDDPDYQWKDEGYFKKGFGENHWIYLKKDYKNEKFCFVNLIHLIFIKGNVVVDIGGNGPYGDPPSRSLEFFEKVARYIESRI